MSSSESLSVPETYATLRRAVADTLIKGQREIERAKVRTYWETGRLINEHLLQHRDRANYGATTIRKLAKDLQTDHTVLHRCVSFARAFPIVARGQLLNWAHYRLLIPVVDSTVRKRLAAEAAKAGWTATQLAEHMHPWLKGREAGANRVAQTTLLKPKRGTEGICRIVVDGEGMAVDLGFSSYLALPTATTLQGGDYVRVSGKTVTAETGVTKAALYTYRVDVLKVVDGDTLWVKIFLRPDWWVKQKLRLRGIDCPEMSTAAGQRAKRFVDGLMARTTAVEICTTKPDKYDRYLSDIYLNIEGEEPMFLNNALIENGHAVNKDSYAPGDWGEL